MNGPRHRSPKRIRPVWVWIGFYALISVLAFAIVSVVLLHRAGPILKGRVIETLSTRFDSRVEIDRFDVSLLSGIQISGGGLRIFPPDDVVAAGADKPLISVQRFSFRSNLRGLLLKPTRVDTVQVTGLQINIPPREMRQTATRSSHRGKIKIIVNKIVCDDSRLIIGTLKPGKDPKDFELTHIEMRDVGPNSPWQYDATLTNAIPRGDIHAIGTFGPWQIESPGDSPVTGHYTFAHADLNTIKGIGGILSSIGDFSGQLNKIVVDGTTETPDFSLDSANHKIPLHTRFHAVVDGTTGDTYLQSIDARLRDSSFTTRGAVINVKGKGHIIDLDIDVRDGRIQDFLVLAVETSPAIMVGRIHLKAELHLPPGKESVPQKLRLRGAFTLHHIHFTNSHVQDKVDMLSLRARGEAKKAKPEADDVRSHMDGKFSLDSGKLSFSTLTYTLPGAEVRLSGVYSLDGNEFDFHGKVRTQAKLSQMVASRWKSWLLKPIDPFFKKNGAGAEIPVKISGTRSAPKFGLDLHHKDTPEKNTPSSQPKP